MENKDKKIFFIRKFLNKKGHETIALIYFLIERDIWTNKDAKEEHISHSIECTIGDCSRHINLDFNLSNKSDFVNGMYKLNLLIDSLQKFRKAYIKEWEWKQKKKNQAS